MVFEGDSIYARNENLLSTSIEGIAKTKRIEYQDLKKIWLGRKAV